MKIKDLDRNEVYDLTEIKKDKVKFDLLKQWLKDNDISKNPWVDSSLTELDGAISIYFSNGWDEWRCSEDEEGETCALTLFELGITDYQVDCSELSIEQIVNLRNIFEAKGYTLYNTKDALDITNEMKYFRTYYTSYGVFELNSHKEIIEYDKFIELFGEKELTKEELNESVNEQFEKLKPSVEKYIIEPSNSAFLKDLVISKFPYCETTTRRIKEGVFSKLIGMELVIKDNSWYFQEVEKIEKSPYDVISLNQGYKETQGKCNYELDFDFIKDLAMRIQNEPKYDPYNWQKPMNVEQLSNAMLRHVIEVKKGNFDDNGELGHLLAIAANTMFIYYQKKHNE